MYGRSCGDRTRRSQLRKDDRVVVAFPIACGGCFSCQRKMFSLCENSNPNAWMAEKMFGHSPSGIFGYSHLLGGYAGGQAEYARVPFADVGTIKVPEELPDDKVPFLSDIFPTGYMGAEMCNIQGGDTIAVWGCDPVGLFAIKSAFLLDAERVIAIDRFDYRLQMARQAGAESLDMDKFPIGALMNRSLTIKTGQCHVQRYLQPLLERVTKGEIDLSSVITHRMSLSAAPEGYATFFKKEDNCEKVVLKPH